MVPLCLCTGSSDVVVDDTYENRVLESMSIPARRKSFFAIQSPEGQDDGVRRELVRLESKLLVSDRLQVMMACNPGLTEGDDDCLAKRQRIAIMMIILIGVVYEVAYPRSNDKT